MNSSSSLTVKRRQQQERRKLVYDFLLKGETNEIFIASQLGVSQPTISRDIRELDREALTWISSSLPKDALPVKFKRALDCIEKIKNTNFNLIDSCNGKEGKEKTVLDASNVILKCCELSVHIISGGPLMFKLKSLGDMVSELEENSKIAASARPR
jgi:hypothetical protein